MRWAARSRSGAARSGRIRPTRLWLRRARKAPAPPELSNEPGGDRGRAGVGGRGGHGRGAGHGSVVAVRGGGERVPVVLPARPGQGGEGPAGSRRPRLVFFAVAAAALAATLGV